MKSFLIVFSGMLALMLVGCGGESIPNGSFRLTITNVFEETDMRVTRLRVQSLQSGGARIFAGNQGYVASYDMQRKGGFFEENFTIASSRISTSDGAYMQWVVQTKAATARSGGKFSKEAPLDKVVAVTIQDGFYKLDTPVAIGRIDDNGATNLMLAVGPGIQSESKPLAFQAVR